MDGIGVYLHIPFCERKCLYCDFNSGSASEAVKKTYIESLVKEVHMYRAIFASRKVKTLFIGGGTPSSVSPSLFEPLLQALHEVIDFDGVEEFSIEANPGTVTAEKLQLYKKYGINRISFGVQSFNDKLLRRIGRLHNASEAVQSVKLAQRIGFDNINLDLMHNLPDMQPEDLYNSIRQAAQLGVQHISLYSLILEEGTPLYEEYEASGLSLMAEDKERETFHKGMAMLEDYGYGRYEVSNFALAGKQCKHNLIYWEVREYIGLGLGAHGMYDHVRYSNVMETGVYVAQIGAGNFPVEERQALSKEDEAFESIMLGLRLKSGICLATYEARYGLDLMTTYGPVIKKQIELGTLELSEGCLRLTDYGHDISNAVIVEFMA